MSLHFQPMPLLKRAAPFDDDDWLFELKYDGFRALAIVEHGRAQLLSRNGHPFASFSELAESISDCLPSTRAVIDGEICSLDKRGRPQFKNLLFRRGNPCFFAFDLLTCDGKDLRTERLLDRKQELRRLLARSPANAPLKYTEYIDGQGTALFQRICKLTWRASLPSRSLGLTSRSGSTALGSRFGIPTIHNGQAGRNCSNVNGVESQSQDGIRVRLRARSWSTSMPKRVSSFYEECKRRLPLSTVTF
jgi:hypothetical protein